MIAEPMTATRRVDIAIPILNEESTLDRQVRKAAKFLQEPWAAPYDIRLVIADNGSTDQSPVIGRKLSQEIDLVAYDRVPKPGIGRALKHVWLDSQADIVGYMDLDLATDLGHLVDALALIADDRADIVNGSRLMAGSIVANRSVTREVVSRVFNIMVRHYFWTDFTDAMCGFKFLHRRHVRQLTTMGADNDRWFFGAELLVCAHNAGLRLVELPIYWTDDSNSKVKVFQLALENIGAMRRLKRRLNTRRPVETRALHG